MEIIFISVSYLYHVLPICWIAILKKVNKQIHGSEFMKWKLVIYKCYTHTIFHYAIIYLFIYRLNFQQRSVCTQTGVRWHTDNKGNND